MKKMVMMAMAIGLLMGGCAHTQPLYWTKTGGTMEAFNQDKYECIKETHAMTSPQSYLASGELWFVIMSQDMARRRARQEIQFLFNSCMEAKGWKK